MHEDLGDEDRYELGSSGSGGLSRDKTDLPARYLKFVSKGDLTDDTWR